MSNELKPMAFRKLDVWWERHRDLLKRTTDHLQIMQMRCPRRNCRPENRCPQCRLSQKLYDEIMETLNT